MSFSEIAKTQAINILAALLIGIFVVFPDVLRSLDKNEPPDHFGPEEIISKLEEQGGNEFDIPPELWMEMPPQMEKRPEPPDFNGYQNWLFDMAYFFLLSWALLLFNNPYRRKSRVSFSVSYSRLRNLIVIVSTFVLCYLGIFLYTLIHINDYAHFSPFPWYMNGMLLFKGIFVYVSVVLFGQLIKLINRQQYMMLENERLKTESLQNRYEALTAQVSPHFFFNALNSLSGLIREKENENALKYVSEISNMFRYILQGKWQELVTLHEEMHFLNAYRYLLDIKYGSKLKFMINFSEEEQDSYMLPALSLQPLVENVIKHNVISEEEPMDVRLYIRDGKILVIENLYQPRVDSGFSSGIGLTNLENRYKYLTGKNIYNYIKDAKFVVELPLSKKW